MVGCEENGSRCQCYAAVKQLVKWIGTGNGSNRLVALEARIRNPNVCTLHEQLLATFDKIP